MKTIVIELSIKDYKDKWNSMKGSMRYTAPNIAPVSREMIVKGQSGPGTPFKNEYERMHHEWLNPRMPSCLYFYGYNERITYIPRKVKHTLSQKG